MPIYEHSETGNRAELSREHVKAYADGVWKLVEEEGPNERADRELREHLENKVSVENEDGTEALPETDAARRKREKAQATAAAAQQVESKGDLHPPAATIVKDQEGAE